VGSVPYAVRADTAVGAKLADKAAVVANPYCSSQPCAAGDIVEIKATVEITAGGAEVKATCPQTNPIPIAGGCDSTNWMDLSHSRPLNWAAPAGWSAPEASKRAAWGCYYVNADTDVRTGRAYIVCRR